MTTTRSANVSAIFKPVVDDRMTAFIEQVPDLMAAIHET